MIAMWWLSHLGTCLVPSLPPLWLTSMLGGDGAGVGLESGVCACGTSPWVMAMSQYSMCLLHPGTGSTPSEITHHLCITSKTLGMGRPLACSPHLAKALHTRQEQQGAVQALSCRVEPCAVL